MKLICFVAFALLLQSSAPSFSADRSEALQAFVKQQRIGSSQDFWIEQKSRLRNQWDRIGLVMGTIDDYGTCADLARLYRLQYPFAE